MSNTLKRVVNDLHSQLNATTVARIVRVNSVADIQQVIVEAGRRDQAISIAGKRHAMGAQQFGTDTILVDTTGLRQVLHFDQDRGLVDVEAGVQWPELINHLISVQQGRYPQWGIAQKQTGADGLTLGGAIAANAHGRGLTMRPIIADIESFELIDAAGRIQTCSRKQNRELFRLVIGGYGLFGLVYKIRLRLVPRQKVERVVTMTTIDQLMPAFEQCLAAGHLYGDFPFSTDERAEGFLQDGILACYRPVDWSSPMAARRRELSVEDWRQLIYLAHVDKAAAFRTYAGHYQATSGQIYESDTHQLSVYLDDYHRELDKKLGATQRASEIITEIYVPRQNLADFMTEARAYFRQNGVNLIYGTVRLIERDDESFLAWARQAYACIIFNLHTSHTPPGLAHSAVAFRCLIDMAIKRHGSYFLTYHKYATRRQVEACYPQFSEFLRLKRKYDPQELFQSDWYRHYMAMFADVVKAQYA
jgi:FAD/FMN-containing dehydrogenase